MSCFRLCCNSVVHSSYLLPRLLLLWLTFLLGRDSGNLELVQLVREVLVEAEDIRVADLFAHWLLLENIPALRRWEPHAWGLGLDQLCNMEAGCCTAKSQGRLQSRLKRTAWYAA